MLLNLLFHLVSSLTNKIVQDELTQLMGPINQLHNEASVLQSSSSELESSPFQFSPEFRV